MLKITISKSLDSIIQSGKEQLKNVDDLKRLDKFQKEYYKKYYEIIDITKSITKHHKIVEIEGKNKPFMRKQLVNSGIKPTIENNKTIERHMKEYEIQKKHLEDRLNGNSIEIGKIQNAQRIAQSKIKELKEHKASVLSNDLNLLEKKINEDELFIIKNPESQLAKQRLNRMYEGREAIKLNIMALDNEPEIRAWNVRLNEYNSRLNNLEREKINHETFNKLNKDLSTHYNEVIKKIEGNEIAPLSDVYDEKLDSKIEQSKHELINTIDRNIPEHAELLKYMFGLNGNEPENNASSLAKLLGESYFQRIRSAERIMVGKRKMNIDEVKELNSLPNENYDKEMIQYNKGNLKVKPLKRREITESERQAYMNELKDKNNKTFTDVMKFMVVKNNMKDAISKLRQYANENPYFKYISLKMVKSYFENGIDTIKKQWQVNDLIGFKIKIEKSYIKFWWC